MNQTGADEFPGMFRSPATCERICSETQKKRQRREDTLAPSLNRSATKGDVTLATPATSGRGTVQVHLRQRLRAEVQIIISVLPGVLACSCFRSWRAKKSPPIQSVWRALSQLSGSDRWCPTCRRAARRGRSTAIATGRRRYFASIHATGRRGRCTAAGCSTRVAAAATSRGGDAASGWSCSRWPAARRGWRQATLAGRSTGRSRCAATGFGRAFGIVFCSDLELNATVELTTFVGLVGCYRSGLAKALGRDASGVDSAVDQVLPDGVGAAL